MILENSFAKIVLLWKNDKCLYDNDKKFAKVYARGLRVQTSAIDNEIIESFVTVIYMVVVLNVDSYLLNLEEVT